VPIADLPCGFTTRFAPAPTGHLHLGHIVSAIWVWGLARAFEGKVLLRIEDHDRGRCRPEYETDLLEDLEWLGFVPDTTAPRQSDRTSRYIERIAELESQSLAYACTCSRRQIASAGATAEDGDELRYAGMCRGTAKQSETPARRVLMEPGAELFYDLRLGRQQQDPAEQCGDLLARDRNGNFTYQFAVVVDDIDQGVDVVVRGEDLLASTGRQLRLARLLGHERPPRFVHHPLVHNANGQKLSKSVGDSGVRELRAAGLSAAEVIGRAAALADVAHDGSAIRATDLASLFR
jgi:glutamyl-tRNA synthetase/glutamyl-Q tRNA(Asp) synthetase